MFEEPVERAQTFLHFAAIHPHSHPFTEYIHLHSHSQKEKIKEREKRQVVEECWKHYSLSVGRSLPIAYSSPATERP